MKQRSVHERITSDPRLLGLRCHFLARSNNICNVCLHDVFQINQMCRKRVAVHLRYQRNLTSKRKTLSANKTIWFPYSRLEGNGRKHMQKRRVRGKNKLYASNQLSRMGWIIMHLNVNHASQWLLSYFQAVSEPYCVYYNWKTQNTSLKSHQFRFSSSRLQFSFLIFNRWTYTAVRGCSVKISWM